ncbi:MAG: hypothetical protein ACI8RD_006298 [Bacillariaceae sp.]|jgi:hypothetical protein
MPAAKASYVTKKSENVIQSLMDFLRLQSRLEAKNGKPTYAHFLGLSASPLKNDDEFDDDDEYPSFVQENQFSFLGKSNTDKHQKEPPSLVFRYRFPSNDRLRHLFEDPHYEHEQRRVGIKSQQHQQQVRHRHNLSTYMSIMDEVTTFGLISATPQYPRPGVSVTMQSQWGPQKMASSSLSVVTPTTDNNDNDKSSSLILGEEVDIVTTITKMGRNLGFVRAEVRDPSTGGVICFFDHVKYLPPGFLFSIILTPIGRWFVDNIYLRYNNIHHKRSVIAPTQNNNDDYNNDDNNNGNDYSGIMDSFRITSDTTASFRFGSQHTNGLGGLHGGVQAILMERLGQVVARNEILQLFTTATTSCSSTTTDDPSGDNAINYHNNDVGVDFDVECEQIQASYQSSASTRRLELRAYVMDPPRLDRLSITLRIEILRDSNKPNTNNNNNRKSVVVSEGILTFVKKSPSSKTI